LTKILQQRISRITAILAFAGLLMLFATQPAPAQTLKALYSFTGAADGGDPFPAVIRDAAGNLYGTTDYAGVILDAARKRRHQRASFLERFFAMRLGNR
jgi:hypothetical protein